MEKLKEPDGRVMDESLMSLIAAGEEQALAELMDRWKTPLINFFYRSLSSMEQSEDLAQMVFIRLYRAAPKYKPTAKFSTFLFHCCQTDTAIFSHSAEEH